jgi:phage tail sheath protein FI
MMATQYATPGVYIEEITGPGVIAGVGTSTAAFIGPASKGPLLEARRITSLDEFIDLFGGTRDGAPWPFLYVQGRPYYLGFAVQGFFQNGGQYAYIVRVGTAAQAEFGVDNQAGEPAFIVRALQDGATGDQITIETQRFAVQLPLASATANVTNVAGTVITVDATGDFRVDDFVTTDGVNRAQITQIQGNDITLDVPLAGAANGDVLTIDDVRGGTTTTFRMERPAALYAGGTAVIDDPANTERVEIQSVSQQTRFVELAAAPANPYSIAAPPTLTSIRVVAVGTSNVVNSQTITTPDGQQVSEITVGAGGPFRPGDIVTSDGVNRGVVDRVQGNVVTLDGVLAGIGANLLIANLTPAQTTLRVLDTRGLYPGTVVEIRGDDANNPGNEVTDYAVVNSASPAGIVTFADTPARANTFNLDVAAGSEPVLTPQEFSLEITPPPPQAGTAQPERFENLSLNVFHPRCIFNVGIVTSDWVTVEEPAAPPTSDTYPNALAAIGGPAPLAGGADDQPSGLTAVEYEEGLSALADVDDVNMVCIPDAAAHPEREQLQNDMINHCVTLHDRVAILDPIRGAPATGPGSAEQQRQAVTSPNGFAALYYPWLIVRDPTSTGPQPRTMVIPPSGHIAGVWARTDSERGVHKPPANTDVRGVLGLETILSDRQQGPLNLGGVDVLRIFPGNRQVIVWGARTTVDPTITDWLYLNVRRLLLYIEESIAEGIRWAVFEPNDLALWKKLDRTISDFLERVWRDGGLFGAKAEEAFRVRIDEALNPPSVRALGRLYIEIKVAPVRPAEFIVVRIGLWDGGSETTES